MARVIALRKGSKKVARGTRPKAVVISRPTSPKRTEKTFGVGVGRSRDIDAMVNKVITS